MHLKLPRLRSGRRIGLALGGGGARGFAHIPVLELLDELKIRPWRMAGTSMGAVIGILYAAGRTGAQIRKFVENVVLAPDTLNVEKILSRARVWKQWMQLLLPKVGQKGLVRTDGIVRHLYDQAGVSTFEELKIPMKVVAAVFWTGETVVFQSGPLLAPIQASMAIPVLFEPVVRGDQLLVDGGVSNLVPYDLLQEDCSSVIAVNVSRGAERNGRAIPRAWEFGHTVNIMQQAVLRERMKHAPPDFYVQPSLEGFHVLEFHRYHEILEHAQPAIDTLRKALLERFGPPPA